MDEQLKSDVDRIVETGERIREQVRDAVEAAASRAEAAPSRLADLSQAVVDGAMGAIDRSTPEEPESTLRQVVDGLADGLGRTAQATRLAVEEAAGEGRAYAGEDLKHVAEDFKAIGQMFVETVERGLSGAGSQTGETLRNVVSHAEKTFGAVRPSIEDAARVAAHHPIGLAGESASAAAKVTREAAGGLFSAVGKLLDSAGKRITPDGSRPDDSDAS